MGSEKAKEGAWLHFGMSPLRVPLVLLFFSPSDCCSKDLISLLQRAFHPCSKLSVRGLAFKASNLGNPKIGSSPCQLEIDLKACDLSGKSKNAYRGDQVSQDAMAGGLERGGCVLSLVWRVATKHTRWWPWKVFVKNSSFSTRQPALTRWDRFSRSPYLPVHAQKTSHHHCERKTRGCKLNALLSPVSVAATLRELSKVLNSIS